MEDLFSQRLKQTQAEYDEINLPVICSETEKRDVIVEMKDGVGLKTYLYIPGNFSEQKKYPVIMQRSPYAQDMAIYDIHGENLAKRGFVYILQQCRGTAESGGEWFPNVNEREDGLCTLDWLCRKAWVKNVGYWGDSYLALTGWCMADAVPEKVKGMYLGVYGTDRWISAYQKRLFRHDVLTSWAMENAGFPVTADYEESCRYQPHFEVDEMLWGKKLPWYRDWITAVDEDSEYWQHGFWKQLREIPGKVKIPVLIREGWYDHHLGSAIRSFETLNPDVKATAAFMVGCWNHFSQNCIEWMKPQNLQNSEVKSMMDWFTELLVKDRNPEPKISVYVIGMDEWKELEAWPMPCAGVKTFYLTGERDAEPGVAGKLTGNRPELQTAVGYQYDPKDPVPSLGAESMLHHMEKVGSLYQPEPGFRPDVLSFVSGAAEESFIIGGRIKIHLLVSSDCEDTAFTAKVMEVKPDGSTVNIRSSITTIAADSPDRDYVPGEQTEVTIEMWDIAWQVAKGSRLRVDISSSDFPQYAIHSNFPGIWSKQEKSRIAHQNVFCGGLRGSRVELPVLKC